MVEMENIPVESLVPEPLRALKGGDEYMARLPEFDAAMETRLKEAEASGEVGCMGQHRSGRWGAWLGWTPRDPCGPKTQQGSGRLASRNMIVGYAPAPKLLFSCSNHPKLPPRLLFLSPQVLRYVGVVDVPAGRGAVELRRYPKNHPFAQLNGSDNIIAFTTKRYAKQPLVVRGPGAGADVTAGGVFADLLRLAAYLGAPS